jgi:tetraacyldisaccharide 4'-kinase
LETLQNTRVAAICAIGNPEAFRRTLHACGCKVVAWQAFPDHHRYQPQELMQFASLAQQQRPEIFVCTAKDLVKIATDEPFGLPLWSLHIALEFRRGQATLNRKIAEISRLAK